MKDTDGSARRRDRPHESLHRFVARAVAVLLDQVLPDALQAQTGVEFLGQPAIWFQLAGIRDANSNLLALGSLSGMGEPPRFQARVVQAETGYDLHAPHVSQCLCAVGSV